MKGVSTGLDKGMEKREREKSNMWVPMVCESGNQHCSLSRTLNFCWSENSKTNVDDTLVCFLAVDVVRHLEMQRIVGLVQRGFARPSDKNLERTSSHPAGSWQSDGTTVLGIIKTVKRARATIGGQVYQLCNIGIMLP